MEGIQEAEVSERPLIHVSLAPTSDFLPPDGWVEDPLRTEDVLKQHRWRHILVDVVIVVATYLTGGAIPGTLALAGLLGHQGPEAAKDADEYFKNSPAFRSAVDALQHAPVAVPTL